MTTNFRVSPVIGVIIMVGITVILLAGVAWVVFGMSGSAPALMGEKTTTISGFIIDKQGDTQGGGTIFLISTDPQGTHKLHVASNAEFNKVQSRDGRMYSVKVAGLEVKEIKGPL